MDMRRAKPKPKILPMDRRIKPNPKYENVQPAVNTGHNLRKQMERMQEANQYYRFRPDEIFRRMTITSLVTLMLEQSKLEIQEENEQEASNDGCQSSDSVGTGKAKAVDEESCVDSALEQDDNDSKADIDEDSMIESVVFKGKMIRRSTSVQSHSKSVADLLYGVVDGRENRKISNGSSSSGASSGFYQGRHQKISSSSYGSNSVDYHHHDSSMAASTFMLPGAEDEVLKPSELHRSVSEGHLLKSESKNNKTNKSSDDKPYLLLDIRPVEDYEIGHIFGAKSYPHFRLTRAVNFETQEMLAFKNREGKVIVVYDFDENLAYKCATTLVERGYDNVFMLSGGLRVARMKFPRHLVIRNSNNNGGENKLSPNDIDALQDLLEEAMVHGTSRLSTYTTPSICSSRMQQLSGRNAQNRITSSQSNLSRRSVSPQKRRVPLHAPLKPSLRSGSTRRS